VTVYCKTNAENQGGKMDYESEINELKDRLAKLEQRLEGIKAEVKTLITKWNRKALVYDNFDCIYLRI
jgi:cell division protein FtsB